MDGIEAVDDRHEVDGLFVAELNELSDAITDRLTARALGRREPAKNCGAIPVHHHGLCVTTGQQSRPVVSQQLHDEAFADALAAEGQNVEQIR